MGHRIMLVDDAQVIRLILTRIFTNAGYEIVGEANNGAEAIKKYQEVKPDLVTMDITMPGMSGINAVKEIMKIDPNAKIIMCSAMGQKSMVMEAIEAGAKNFMIKPFEPENVIEVAKSVLGE